MNRPVMSAGGGDDVLAVVVDVADADQVMSLKETVYDTFGEVSWLMNNARVVKKLKSIERFAVCYRDRRCESILALVAKLLPWRGAG